MPLMAPCSTPCGDGAEPDLNLAQDVPLCCCVACCALAWARQARQRGSDTGQWQPSGQGRSLALGLAKPSEIMGTPFNKTGDLLAPVKGLILVPLDRPDDCCGFGGMFCVTDPAVSAQIGIEKVRDHLGQGADYNASPRARRASRVGPGWTSRVCMWLGS
jgi:hypothetical protein